VAAVIEPALRIALRGARWKVLEAGITTTVALACATTGPNPPQGPNGTFAAAFDTGARYLAVELQESRGVISGTGWSSVDNPFFGGATVVGAFTAPTVHFDLIPLVGGAAWHFNGTLDPLGRSLSGEFAYIVGKGFPVALRSVDTIPTGHYGLELVYGARQHLTGSATFTYLLNPTGLLLRLYTDGVVSYQTVFLWSSATLPPPDTYTTSGSSSAGLAVGLQRVCGNLIDAFYQVGPGTITIDVSEQFVLTGHYAFTATDSTGATLTLQGVFSAGCIGGNRC
jgi:hypothetical protein